MKTRILIVEDEFPTAHDIERKSLKWGYHVVGIAADGPKALALSKSARPDMLLVDHRLIGPMSGAEVTNAVSRLGDPAIVVVSAYPEHVVRPLLSDPPDAYLEKPFSSQSLRAAIATAESKLKHRREEHARRNARRITLLKQALQKELLQEEQTELEQLEKETDAYVDATSPVDMSKLEEGEQRLQELEALLKNRRNR